MKRRQFVLGVGTTSLALVAGCAFPFSQTPRVRSIRRVAYLSGGLPNATGDAVESFRRGIRDLGYVEGQDIVIEERYHSGDDQVAVFAAEIERLQPEVIVVPSAIVARVVHSVTTTIPIVSVGQNDLAALGLVASLARPGGNVTGLSSSSLVGKQLQLLQEAVPGLSRVAAILDSNIDTPREPFDTAARGLGLELKFAAVTGPDELDSAFNAAVRDHADGLIVSGGPFIQQNRGEALIVELALQTRMPSVWTRSDPIRIGGLMGYGANRADLYRRAATYVDKILNGANPGDLPIEQPALIDFAINLSTARTLGLTIPQSVLAQATEVVQ